MSRRRGSAIALNGSAVVQARAIRHDLYMPIWEYVNLFIFAPGLTPVADAWDKQTTVFTVQTCACCCCGENASGSRAVSYPIATA